MPPLVGLAVKVTDVPAHIVWLGETLKLTDGVKIGLTVTVEFPIRFWPQVPLEMEIKLRVWLAVRAFAVTVAVPPVSTTVELLPPLML